MKDFLRALCTEAGGLLRRRFGEVCPGREKRDAGIVTEADLRSEELLVARIRAAFPRAAILTEEAGALEGGDGELRFVVDPLDGTTNFASGIPHFAVSIGVELEGELAFGAVYHPMLEELCLAERGGGAALDGRPIEVRRGVPLERSVWATGDLYERGARFEESLGRLGRVYASCRALRVQGSVALALAGVAAGRLDGFWLERSNSWDVAAGSLLVREAGGVVTDFAGAELEASRGGDILAADAPLAAALRGALLAGATGR
jgi:myo-inositol-1(or 4)-monophosphatase